MSAVNSAPSAFMSPLREAAKKASASFEPALLLDLEARSRLADMGARSSSKLPAGRRVALDGRRDLLEFQPKHIVQQKGRPLEWRKPFQRQHQRQGDVFLFVLVNHRVGKPGTDISLALVTRRLELIEAEPRDRTAQERLGLAHRAAVGSHPADEGLLHHILGVSHGAEHAISDARELGTQRIETRRCVLMVDACHQATARTAAFAAAGSSQMPKPTARRFHPLMILITSVSFTCSSSVNSVFKAS